MKYYKLYNAYKHLLDKLPDDFLSKDAKEIGLTVSVLTKMRFRGIIERIQYKANKFLWRKAKV